MVREYLRFHFIEAPKRILRLWSNFLVFFYYFFSVRLLIFTFFAPWKRIYQVKASAGFFLTEWFNRLTYNLISSSIGAFIRFWALVFWLIAEIFVVFLGGILFFLWFFLFPLSLPLYFFGKRGKSSTGREKRLADFLSLRFPNTPLGAVPLEDKEEVIHWFERQEEERWQRGHFWELDRLLRHPGIGKDWASGYTIELDRHTEDLTAPLAYSSHLVARQRELAEIEQILGKSKGSNALLVGEPGVGRKTIVQNFAKAVAEGRVIPSLARGRVLLLNLSGIIGMAKNPSQIEAIVAEILREATEAGNVILVIEEFDRYVSTGQERIDLSPVLSRFMSEGELHVIGITTPDDYQRYIFPNQNITKMMEKIEVGAPSANRALEILEDIVPDFEYRTGITVSFPALKEIVKRGEALLVDVPFPEKAIDLLDESLVFVKTQLKSQRILLPAHVQKVLVQKTGVPIEALSIEERERLLKLEDILHQRLVDQEEAIRGVARALRRARIGISARGKPIGTFLFLGPTGVGKTETAKALAEALFGSESRIIRLDMASFQGEEGNLRLIGSFRESQPGVLTSSVRNNPYSVLLLDEIEKASNAVLNLLLTVIDEGYLTDAQGRRVSFENVILIATSNAGAEFIREKVNEGVAGDALNEELLEYVLRERIFSPEFINRFDGVIVYKPLTHEHLLKIAENLLLALNRRLAEKGISLAIDQELCQKIAEMGFHPVFGARPMKRVILEKIEAPIAQKLLSGEVKRGEKVRISL